MPTTTETRVNDLIINKMSKAQFDALQEKSPTELYIVEGDSNAIYAEQITALPTAAAGNLGRLYQYIGATDANYTNGYFYKCTETWGFVGPVPDATGEPGESMVFALDYDAFAAYLQTKSIVLAGQTTFYLGEETDAETGDSFYALQDADYVTIEEFSSLVDMESTTGITWGGQEDFTGDFPYLAENETGFIVGPTYAWNQIDVQPASSGLPDQTGQSGKFLTTDGTDASWAAVNALPSQTGQAGKFLTTNGSAASWSNKPLVNNATGSYSLAVAGGTAGSYTDAVAIGQGRVTGDYGICIGGGYNAQAGYLGIGVGGRATGQRALALGFNEATANYSIQLGSGDTTRRNTDANTFKVGNKNGNYEMMSANGTIPTDRFTTTPVADGTYVPTLTIASGVATRSWAAPGGGGSVPTLTWYTISTAGTTLTIADTSSAQLVKIYKNGLLLQPTEDYTISGTTLTTVSAMVVGDKITTEVF